MALQRIQVAIVLHKVVMAIREASSKLGVLPSFLPHLLAQLALCY
jgi:hypothetical protein